MPMFSFTPEEKKPEKRKPVKQTLVETIGGRNVFLEDGEILVLEEFPFRASRASQVGAACICIVWTACACLVIADELGYHVASSVADCSRLLIAIFAPVLRAVTPHDDRILLEMRDKDVVSGNMRLGRPINVRYTRGWTPAGYTIFVWDDDGKWPPKRPLYSSYSQSNIDRMAALVDRFLGRGPVPEPAQIEWPPAPKREAVSLAAKEDAPL